MINKRFIFILLLLITIKNIQAEPDFLPNTEYKFYSHTPTLKSPIWPEWAHQQWVWENEGTTNSATKLVNDYLQNDIPISAIVIDRPWDTSASNLIPDTQLYPQFSKMIQYLHSKNIKVMLWSVSLLNKYKKITNSQGLQEKILQPEFQEGFDKNYFKYDGKLVHWWGGDGALLDYDNPEAVNWWHKRMDHVLEMGIDGWKLDGIDPYVILAKSETNWDKAKNVLGLIFNPHSSARKEWDHYRNQYYQDYWDYSVKKTGKKIVITSRPIDQLEPIGVQFPFTPTQISFSGWVGDQDGNWKGLKSAIRNLKESAKQNFISFGSDTGGFRSQDGKEKRDKDLFIRWTQMSAFNSVFENGGGGEHRPWMYDNDVLEIYRKYSKIHESLVPYLYSSAAWAAEGKHSIYLNVENPTSPLDENAEVNNKFASQWNYFLGPNIFVSVIDNKESVVDLNLPQGEWINLLNQDTIFERLSFKVPQKFSYTDYPAFIRNGSIIPVKNIPGSIFSAPQNNGKNIAAVFAKEGSEYFPVYNENDYGGVLSYKFKNKNFVFKVENVKNIAWLRLQFHRIDPISFNDIVVNNKYQKSIPDQQFKNTFWINLDSCENLKYCSVFLKN